MPDNPYEMKHIPEGQERFDLTDETRQFPKMVVINSAYPCNAFCPHCPYTLSNSKIRLEDRAKETPFIPENVFKAIADEVGKHKAILRVSGAGEPLFHKEIVSYIEYAKSVGCEVGIITNGSLMDQEKAERLIDCGIEMIEFSVDAADPETYDIVRKGLKFDETLENVKRTIKIRNERKSNTRIIASVVNQKIVEDKLDSIVDFWDAIVDTVQVRKYLTWDINDLSESANLTPYLDSDAPCPFPFDRLLIDTNGDMRFCVYDIKGRTNWGSVLKESISSVWVGEKFKWLRDLHNDREFEKMKICENCLDRQFRSWNYNYFTLRDQADEKRTKKAAQA